MELSKDERHALRVLYNMGCWGKGAMYAENIVYRGSSRRILEKLEKEGLIAKFRHSRGLKYHLVKEKRAEIEALLGIEDIRNI